MEHRPALLDLGARPVILSPGLRRFVTEHRDLVVVALAALAVRLVWNLAVHRPLDYVASDMAGYLERAQASIDAPDDPQPYLTLFPWGTHWLVSLIKRAFGRDNGTAIGAIYAVIGAASVAYGFALARRFTRSRRVAWAVGALLVVYYPWIALGGYTLSEPPFTLVLCASAFHVLAYADRGRPRDAWLFGASLALGAIFRPQILAALPLYGLHVAFRRRAWHGLRWSTVGPAVAAPLAVCAVISAARMQFHTGSYGFVSSNGSLNFAFGRCHATTISAAAPDRRGVYSPPPLGALARREADHPDAFFRLDPAQDLKIHFEGHLWDDQPLRWISAECVRRTGLLRQARYALTHLVLLWFYDTMWPDQNVPRYRPYMDGAQTLHDVLVLPAALVAMALAFGRRRARALLLALPILALMGVAMVYFGDTRLRAPYDGLLVTLAAATYASAVGAIRRRTRSKRAAVASIREADAPVRP